MATRYPPTDYLYSTARIRAVENRLIGKDILFSLFEKTSVMEVARALSAYGLPLHTTAEGDVDTEAMLGEYLEKGTRTLLESIPDTSLLYPLQYPYDCHNIKSYLKATLRGLDAAPFLIEAGSVPTKTLLNALQSGDLSCLPTHLREAVGVAKETYAKTKEPKDMDIVLDAAAFADMEKACADFPFGKAVLAKKADVTNIQMVHRLTTYGNKYLASAVFERAMVTGGTLTRECFLPVFEDDVPLKEVLRPTAYAHLFAKSPSPAKLEKLGEDTVMWEAKKALHVSFGAEVPYAYYMALQTSAQNLRLLFAAKRAGLDSTAFRERVRDNYV